MHQFSMVSGSSDIVEWLGVPACDLDAVFEYKGKIPAYPNCKYRRCCAIVAKVIF